MKRLTLLIAMGLSVAPFLGYAVEPLEVKPIVKKESASSLNLYVATNFLLSVMPGVRWQLGHWGADLGVALAPIGGIQSVNGNALYYFNPQDNTKHYLSLGVSTFPALQNFAEQINETLEEENEEFFLSMRKVTPSIAYGFQKGFSRRGYLFMNFGVYGPVGFTVHSEEGSQSLQIPLPFINLGYAF